MRPRSSMPGASAVASQSSRRSRQPCITRDQPEPASGLPRDAKAEVERLNRLGQLADRDVVDAGKGVGAGVVQTDLARYLDLGPALDLSDRLANLARREVLEQQDVDFGRQCLVELLHVRDRELDALAGMGFAQLADD